MLALGGNLTLNIDLKLASVQESVTVSGHAPLIETSEKSLETNISPAEVDDLPVKGRQFVDLALLAPGVTVDTASANSATDSISFGGFNEQFKSLWLEGIDINDEVTGGGSGLSNASRHTFSQEIGPGIPDCRQSVFCRVRAIRERCHQHPHQVGQQPRGRPWLLLFA